MIGVGLVIPNAARHGFEASWDDMVGANEPANNGMHPTQRARG